MSQLDMYSCPSAGCNNICADLGRLYTQSSGLSDTQQVVLYDPTAGCSKVPVSTFKAEMATAIADGVVTGFSLTAGGVLTLTRSQGLPPLSVTLPPKATLTENADGSLTFSNGIDAAVTIPKPFVPSDANAIDDLMLAIKASTYGTLVNNAFGVPQFYEINIPI